MDTQPREQNLVLSGIAGLSLGFMAGFPYLFLEFVRRGYTRYHDFWAVGLVLTVLTVAAALGSHFGLRRYAK